MRRIIVKIISICLACLLLAALTSCDLSALLGSFGGSGKQTATETKPGKESRPEDTQTETETETEPAETECPHSYVLKETVAPTCDEEGYSVYVCELCEDTQKRDYTDPLGHLWDEIVETSPSCSAEGGYTIYRCSRCGETKEDRDSASAGHILTSWTVTHEPSCEEAGEREAVCQRCGETVTEPVAALGHHYGEWTISVTPGCTEDGEEESVCDRCHDRRTRTVEATGHTYIYELPADGSHSVRVCAACGEGHVDGAVQVPAGNSVYGYDSLANDTMRKLYIEWVKQAEVFGAGSNEQAAVYNLNGKSLHSLPEINFASMGLDASEAQVAYKAFSCDGATYYWLDMIVTTGIVSQPLSKIRLIVDDEYYQEAYRRELNEKLETAIGEMMAQLSPGQKDYEKAVTLYQALMKRVDYAYKADGVTPMDTSDAHSIAGMVNSGEMVCEGYAQVLQILMNRAGIPCLFVSGLSGEVNHAWNMIQLGGKWFDVDVTYDDVSGKYYRMYYFCLPDNEFAGNHREETSEGEGLGWLYDLPQTAQEYVMPVTLIKNDTESIVCQSPDAAFDAMTDATANYTIVLDGSVWSEEYGSKAFVWDYRIDSYTWPNVAGIVFKGKEIVYENTLVTVLSLTVPNAVILRSSLVLDCVEMSKTNLTLGNYELLLSGTLQHMDFNINGNAGSSVYTLTQLFATGNIKAGTLDVRGYTSLDGSSVDVSVLAINTKGDNPVVLEGAFKLKAGTIQVSGIKSLIVLGEGTEAGSATIGGVEGSGGTSTLLLGLRIRSLESYPALKLSVSTTSVQIQLESSYIRPGQYDGTLYTLDGGDNSKISFYLNGSRTTLADSGDGQFKFAS